MKKIAILGSTGSIGTQTLDVVRANGDIEVLGISAGKNIQKLEEQVREFSPRLVAVWDENAAQELAQKIQDTDTKVVAGMDGLLELAASRIQKFWLLQSWECLGFARRSRRSVQERTLHLPIRKLW